MKIINKAFVTHSGSIVTLKSHATVAVIVLTHVTDSAGLICITFKKLSS